MADRIDIRGIPAGENVFITRYRMTPREPDEQWVYEEMRRISDYLWKMADEIEQKFAAHQAEFDALEARVAALEAPP